MERTLKDRAEAGRLLGEKLSAYANRQDVLVLALPRGGVPVAYEIARRLKAPLDVFIVRKLGVPWQPELAMGAIATGGVRVLNDDIVRSLRISPEQIARVEALEQAELDRREQRYRRGQPAPPVEGRIVILVDNGIVIGATIAAAVDVLRKLKFAWIVVAAAVAPRSTYEQLKGKADEVACVFTPEYFQALSLWYENFSQTTDEEVHELLERAANNRAVTA
jgi:putative phosphoribosyl transferase